MSNQIQSELIGCDEVAAILGISKPTVYALLRKGALPAPIRLGGLTRWSRSALLAWVAAGCPVPAKDASEISLPERVPEAAVVNVR